MGCCNSDYRGAAVTDLDNDQGTRVKQGRTKFLEE